MKMNVTDVYDCCGCGCCEMICPLECISMKEEVNGHLFPNLDEKRCISCSKCLSVCPCYRIDINNGYDRKLYAAYSKDEKLRFTSSSGGMFGTFASEIIRYGGIVYGASFDHNLQLKCKGVTNCKDLYRLFKSKYIQCDMQCKLEEIKEHTENGKYVMVCSTPCQISALKKYIGRDYDNLVLIDFPCHGVPSQSLFDKCLKWVGDKRKINITGYEFRSKKKNGKTPHYFTYTYVKKSKTYKQTKLFLSDPFYYGFQRCITMRSSCYHCPYSEGIRASDITIGDFHDIDEYWNDINRFDGISMVIVNSLKGKKLFEKILPSIEYKEFDYHTMVDKGSVFSGSTAEPVDRSRFLLDLEQEDFNDVVRKWLLPRKDVYKYLYYVMPDGIRMFLKNIIIQRK